MFCLVVSASTVGVKKEYNVITLQYCVLELQCILHTYYTKLQMLLHKTTECTAVNYRQNYAHTQHTHTHKLSKSHTRPTH